MDLRDPITQQAEDLIDWLRKRGRPEEPPSPAVWEELTKEMLQRALFIESFWLPDLADPVTHLPPLQIIRGVGVGAELAEHPQPLRPYAADRVLTLVAHGPGEENGASENGASEP